MNGIALVREPHEDRGYSHRHSAVLELARMTFQQLATLSPGEAANVVTAIEAHITSLRVAAEIG